MKPLPVLIATLLLALATSPAHAQRSSQGWGQSLVQINITQKHYDYFQPWVVHTRDSEGKNGLVIGSNAILTTARNLNDATLIRVQKGGRGQWANAKISWIDYHANLAILEPENDDLLSDLKPVDLGDSDSKISSEEIQIARWYNGKLDIRKAEFTEYNVSNSQLSFVPHVHLYLSCELDSTGRGEIVIADNKVVGLLGSHVGSKCKVIPSSFIKSILKARKEDKYSGLGFFEFVWQPAENPAILEHLGLKGSPRGVVVIDVPAKLGPDSRLKKHDIILEVDGFKIDTQGDYLDPDYGYLQLENISSRNNWAGDEVPLKVFRDGKTLKVNYTLPEANFKEQLVPDQVFDQEPEYLVAGGLVFVPLTDAFLRLWGANQRRAPFRLTYFNHQEASKDRPSLVILSMVLPDPVNLGYQDYRYLVVTKVNGQEIHHPRQIQEALKKPDDGFHIIEFAKGSQISRMILDAAELEGATARVLDTYSIPKSHNFN